MRILHIDRGIDFRGGQKQLLELHKGLLANNIESVILCQKGAPLYNLKIDQVPLISGIEFRVLQIINYIRESNPHIIHFHEAKSLNLLLFKNLKGYKTVETRRVSYPVSFLSRKLKYRKIDVHIAVSCGIYEYLKQYYKNVALIESCLVLDGLQSDGESPYRKKFNLLFIGALSSQKGIFTLLNAYNLLKSEEVALNIVGDGMLKKKIIKFIKNNRLGNSVFLYNFTDSPGRFYKYADVVVVPSISGEGSSGVIKEALYFNKIVIVSDIEPNRKIIAHNENGIIFKSQNVSDLHKKLQSVLKGEITINASCIKDSLQRFDCKTLVSKHIGLYRGLLNER